MEVILGRIFENLKLLCLEKTKILSALLTMKKTRNTDLSLASSWITSQNFHSSWCRDFQEKKKMKKSNIC